MLLSPETPPKVGRDARKRRPLPWRVLKLTVLACLGLELLYVLAGNAFLAFDGLALMFESTNSVNATLRRAWTLWPGSVHVRDLRVVFQDHNLQWAIDLPRGHVNLRLIRLARREFRATSVTGDGLVFTMRHRIPPEELGEKWVAALPSFREFPGPAVFEARVPEPPISDEHYNLWTVHLEGVDVKVREFWTQFVRYRGEGRARGAFRLRPARTLWVGPASLELEPGRLTIGNDEVAARFGGTIGCTVHFFDVRVPVGRQVFRHVSADLALRGSGVRAEAARLFVPDGTRVQSEPGTLRLDARVERGRISEASAFGLELPLLELGARDFTLKSRPLRLRARGKPASRGEAVVDAPRLELERPGATGGPLRAAGLMASATSSSRDTAGDWELVESSLRADELALADARWLNGLADRDGLRWNGGAVRASLAVREAGGVIDARAQGRLEGLAAAFGEGASARLDGELELELSRLAWREQSGAFAGRLRGGRAEIASSGARFELGGLTLSALAEAEHARVHGRLAAELGELRARSRELSARGAGSVEMTIENADLNSGATAGSVRGRLTRFRAATGSAALNGAVELAARFELAGGAASRSRLDARASLRDAVFVLTESGAAPRRLARAARFDFGSELRTDARGRLHGVVRSNADELRAELGSTRFRASPALFLRVSELDTKAATGRLHGTLEVEDFVADDRADGASCPWSTLPHSEVHGELELRGTRGAHGALRAEVQGARLVWGDFRASGGASAEAKLTGVGSEVGAGRVEFRARAERVKLRSGAAITSGWEAEIPELRLDGGLATGAAIRGPLAIDAARVTARIGRTRLEGDIGADLRLDELDLDTKRARLSGAIALEHADLRSGDEAVKDWWARVDVGSLALTAGDNLDLSALFRARLRDAQPGLAVLSASGELPGWISDALPLRELEATGTVNRRCRLTDIRFTHVDGGPLFTRGRLQSVPEAVRGAFLVRLTDLELASAGIAFDADDSDVALFAGDDWLAKQERDLTGRARDHVEGPCVPPPTQCGD